MGLREHRTSRGLSLEQSAIELGFFSKSYMSRLESGESLPTLELALRIQVWSRGEVPAVELRPDLADLIAAAMTTSAPAAATA